MTKVLAFRRPEESCGTCWYYIGQRESHWELDQPRGSYCGHPDRVKDCFLDRLLIEKMGLHRESHEWCPKYVAKDSSIMKKLQFVAGIRFALFNLQRGSVGLPLGQGAAASDDYRELVDQFYLENKKIVTINQYKAAKRNPEYFISLIDEAFEYYQRKSRAQRHRETDPVE